MAEYCTHALLTTEVASVWDVACPGDCRRKGETEHADGTWLVFPYRGVYVHHVGRREAVAEAQQVIFINAGEEYQVSHPVPGGDACLSLGVCEPLLLELAPEAHLVSRERPTFDHLRLRIDPRAQALAALLRHSLSRGAIETLEAETMALTLIRRSLGERTSHAARASTGRQKLVDRAKLVLSSDLGRRWSLAEIAAEVGVSPVYLTQVFQQVEGVPLYRYQLQLRLARALDLLGAYDDLTELGLDLGFSSHSHFSSAFRKAYGRTPAEFRRSARLR